MIANIAHADSTTLDISNPQLGFNGSFKIGRWTAVEFDVNGPAGASVVPVVRTADPDSRATLQPLPAVTLTGKPVHVQGLIRSGRLDGAIQLQLYSTLPVADQSPLAQLSLRVDQTSKWQPLRQTTQLWVTLGKQPFFTKGLERWNQARSGLVRIVELPDSSTTFWSAEMLDGVDALVLNGDASVSAQSSQAIRDWVKTGGRLIIPIGDTASILNDSPLAQWLPLKPTGQIDITKLSGLNELVPRSSTLRTLTTLPAARFGRNTGAVIASGLSEPLVVRAAYGVGHVTMVAVRLDSGPLATWEPESQGHLAAILSGLPNPVDVSAAAAARAEAASELNPAAVTDLQMQLNQSLDHFPGITRSSHWQVMGWIALFAVVIGPLDYLLVTKLLKRPEWTWGTLLMWSLLATGLAVSRGDAMNQSPAVARQVDFADLDLSTNSVSVHSWYGFYSDKTQRLAVNARPQSEFVSSPPDKSRLRLGWADRPSEGFRGMYRSGGIDDSQPQYEFLEDQTGVRNLPLDQWSTGSVASEWTTSPTTPLPVTAELNESGINRVIGTVRHQLPGDLTDWFLAYGNFAYFDRSGPGGQPAPLPPGETWDIAQAGSNLLRGRLLGMIEQIALQKDRLEGEADLRRSAYDPLSANPLLIGVTASFYEVLGGESYTGLQNQSLGRLDLSELLDLDRAVLFGRLKASPTQVKVGESELPIEDQTVLVRIILPVQPAERSSDAPPPSDILNYRR
ncbi:hypothetical protein SAMN05421753_11597 [Planctomicrobium piriforme]|uniref:DUF4350 domain-containing protein n=2 Tax=Planctomicrobium piriforme TaxID=1576369 RepID=A0A1I3NGS0_9PLAN|nr:hypothetical protein SAMN05421753_11597 [Planctomicrobium piriforme]